MFVSRCVRGLLRSVRASLTWCHISHLQAFYIGLFAYSSVVAHTGAKMWAGNRAAGASASSSCMHFLVYSLNWLAVTAVMWPYPVGRISVLEHILTTTSAWLLNAGIRRWKQASIGRHYSCLKYCNISKPQFSILGNIVSLFAILPVVRREDCCHSCLYANVMLQPVVPEPKPPSECYIFD